MGFGVGVASVVGACCVEYSVWTDQLLFAKCPVRRPPDEDTHGVIAHRAGGIYSPFLNIYLGS